MALKKIERTVLSYCEIPQDISESNTSINEVPCDVYVEYRVTPKAEQPGFDDNFDLDNWIIKTYPELEGRTILIHIDY
jgi:hypothetical protein